MNKTIPMNIIAQNIILRITYGILNNKMNIKLIKMSKMYKNKKMNYIRKIKML